MATLGIAWIACAVVAVALLDLSVCYLLNGACLSLYTEGSQGTLVSFAGTAFVSTKWSRGPSRCKQKSSPPEPCYLYLTLAEDASTMVIVNAHLPSGTGGVRYYAAVANEAFCESSRVDAVAVDGSFLKEGRRDVHSGLLRGLTPNCHYSLTVEVEGKNVSSLPHWSFWTAFEWGADQQAQLVLGGDMGSSANVSKLLAHSLDPALPSLPLAVVIGGDVAYDNGMLTCWPTWDDWLDRWEAASKTASRLVPVVLAVGNHDAGTEAYAKTKPPFVQRDTLPFLAFFPHQSFNSAPGGIVPLGERTAYHAHRVGNVLVLALDSGYIHDSARDGEQMLAMETAVLEDRKSASPASVVIASYHVPIYPSSMERWKNKEWEKGPSGEFVSFFDKHHVAIAFENHVHAFKRTVPLRAHRPVEFGTPGTVYLGDGRAGLSGLGVPGDHDLVTQSSESRLAIETRAINHFWLLSAQGASARLRAIDPSGAIFDTCEVTAEVPVSSLIDL